MKIRTLIVPLLLAGCLTGGCDAMPDFLKETLKTSAQSAVDQALQDVIGNVVEGSLGGILDGQFSLEDLGSLGLEDGALGGLSTDNQGSDTSTSDDS